MEKTCDAAVQKAARLIAGADAVLVCAGAGLSANPGYNVYVSEEDYARHYPDMPARGYRTGYETMGLFQSSLPEGVKWGYQVRHMHNMGTLWPPSGGYALLSRLLEGKDFFVETSNVDNCFLRSGFPEDRLYTPQGSWSYYQCFAPCRPDSVFPSRPMLDAALPRLEGRSGALPEGAVPRCPRCKGPCFGNVRGGSWFIHQPYEEQQQRMVAWVERQLADEQRKVVVLEIGAGYNTPTVTRFPMESITRELGARGALVRVNPSNPEVPSDLNAVSLARGWEVLEEILDAPTGGLCNDWVLPDEGSRKEELWQAWERRGQRFDWHVFLSQLRD